jgi:hypothetical protein
MTSQKAGERVLKASKAGSGTCVVSPVVAAEGVSPSVDVDFRGADSIIVDVFGVGDMVEKGTEKCVRSSSPGYNRNSRGAVDRYFIVLGNFPIYMCDCTFGPVGSDLGPERIEAFSGSRNARKSLKRAMKRIMIMHSDINTFAARLVSKKRPYLQ